MISTLRTLFAASGRRLQGDTQGVALLEFALTLPLLLLLSLTGAELTNYITTKMRISQISLHLADNAARIGAGSQLSVKTITESDINDLFIGANLQSGELGLQTYGRIILSSVEPVANPNTNSKYKIAWQRCYGAKTAHASTYGTAGQTNLNGVGPAGRQTIAPEGGVAMFVEVYYEYQPLVKASLAPTSSFTEIASMMVRDRRDTTGGTNGVYQVAGVTPSSC
ncbi:pilus assembly protein [Sphingomonas sp. LB-2]|uniref:pilus assembly protein n=1 Tax=Sphingomonas caeni TaxID=2984949 RepID=UPI00223150AE|nr:pilus assembly protein [Sphingomonas caeni]MCW3849222.1 pilus assembly protein [Sphingomonas caeni]